MELRPLWFPSPITTPSQSLEETTSLNMMWCIFPEHGSHKFIICHPLPHTLLFYWFRPLSFVTKAVGSAHTEHLLWARPHDNHLLASSVFLYPVHLPHCSLNVLSCLWTSNGFRLPAALVMAPTAIVSVWSLIVFLLSCPGTLRIHPHDQG